MHHATTLLATVTDPWESLTQALRDNDTAAFGHPTQPGTPAFHLHHTADVFRFHARKLITAIEPETTSSIPHHEDPIPLHGPWSPEAVLAELTTHAAIFADWLRSLPEGTLAQATIHHSDRDQPAPEFLDMLTRHIVWHAAAIHYRARPTPTTPPHNEHPS